MFSERWRVVECAQQCSVRMYCNTARLSTRKQGRSYLNGAEVDEEVSGAVLGGDEAVALLVVEPLDGAVLAFGGGVHFDELKCVWGGVDVRFFGGEW